MRRPTVFVVDDEPQICELLTRVFQRDGYSVRSFVAGADALAALAAEAPDVVVTDLMMPGMSGLELVRVAREAHPGVRAVLMTGYASVDNVVDALRSGVDDFVTKPFSVAEIRGVVARALRVPRAEPAPASRESQAAPQAGSAALARRFRDVSLVSTVHGLVAGESSPAGMLPRCERALAEALRCRRAVLLAPGGAKAEFRVRSATLGHEPRSPQPGVRSEPLALVIASGVAGTIDAADLRPVSELLDAGPCAAAPLSPGDPHGEDSGALVVSRPSAEPPFDAEELRVLGVLAGALGDVFRTLRSAERAEDAYIGSLCDVVLATESRSPWFARHSERVRGLSDSLGRRLGLPEDDLDVLDTAARLLDLGRVETPDELLQKTGRPSEDEWRLLRRHAERADEMLRPLGRLRHVKPIVRHHHENWDGTGYPDGLSGDAIPYLAALVRITDSFAALTSARAWRPALDGAGAVRRIVELSGRHFHPQLVAAFTEMQGGPNPPQARPA